MNEVKVSLVIQSHLDDIMLEMEINPAQAEKRLRFVKYLIHVYPNTNIKIDIDEVYNEFKSRLGWMLQK